MKDRAVGEPTEISDAELAELEHDLEEFARYDGELAPGEMPDYERRADVNCGQVLSLIAALRSTREQRDAAHALLVDCATHLQGGTRLEEDIAAWRATMQHTLPTADDVLGILAHLTTEEPT